MEENKQHENSAILVFDCHFLMKTLLENKTYCKYSGGSKTERVWYMDSRMCLVFEWSAILIWYKKSRLA